MSNPYRRPMRERVYKPLEFRSLTGEDVAEHYAELWQFALDDTGGVSESFSDIALRLRHGARVACKRLREERDAAVACYAKALAMLDAARLELRARKWLDDWEREYPAGGSRSVEWSCDKLRVKQSGHLIGYFDDHASAARALGWEGRGDG